LYLKAMSRVKGVAVSCGYSHEMPENAGVWHVYPNGGVALLCQHLGESVLDAIRLESPVEKIYVEQGRAVAVRAAGKDYSVSAVISTAPCHILAKMVSGSSALAPIARFRYRPMIFVNMRFVGRRFLPDTVLWTPEGGYPFFRLTETMLSMPWLAPEGKTIITCDIGAEVGDSHWKMSDEALGDLCLRHLERWVPQPASKYLGCRVLRTPIAYPVYLNSYEQDRRAFERSTGIENLISVGRNGEFAHILMEDVYWRTLSRTRRLIAALAGPAASLAA
jgi:protoporphyrinogen oxidase